MRVYVSESGVGVSRRVAWWLACGLSLVLAVTVLGGAPSVAVEGETGEESSEAAEEVLSRPDVVSAGLLAAAEDKRVEVASLRSVSTRSFANPDGTVTEEQFGADRWVEQADGSWVDVDYDLAPDGEGRLAPKSVNEDVTVSAGGSKEAARVTFEDESSLAVSWLEELPEPTVEGGVATYELSEDLDLLVVVTGGGVATRL